MDSSTASSTATTPRNYRKNLKINPKKQKKTSIEMILRKAFNQAAREYVTNSSIGGIKQIFDRKTGWKQRFVWLIFFKCMVIFFVYFLQDTWYNALSRPLILTPNWDAESISQTKFPAIALCNINRISKSALAEVIADVQSEYPHLKKRHLERYFSETGRLLDFSYDEIFDDQRLDNIFISKDYYSRNFTEIMARLSPDCRKMLLKCSWEGVPVDCMSIFTTRKTAKGHCCAFNYILDYDENGFPNKTGEAKRQKIPGFFHGLNVIMDPMIDDYFYPLNVVHGFDVFIFDPEHFADPSAGKVVHRLAEPNRIEFMEMKSVRQEASSEVRKYPFETRKCMFKDEYNEKFHGMYSYSACIVQCRIKSIQNLCQCTPYFLTSGSSSTPVCLIENLKCLNRYKEKFIHLYPSYADTVITDEMETQMEDSMHCSKCLPDCEYTQHVVNSYKTKLDFTRSTFRALQYYGFTKGINLTDKCALSIYYVNAINVVDRLDVVSHWYQILSNISGFGGILIGISVFSVVEIVYFLFVRYVQLICEYYKRK